MRLTNQMRDAFVRDVAAKLPHTDYEERIRAIVQEDAIAQLPEAVRKIYEDPDLRPYLNTSYYYGGINSIAIPCRVDCSPQISDYARIKVAKLKEGHARQKERDTRLKTQLHAVAAGCNTTQQLREALPEFAKFVSEDPMQPVRTLPTGTH